MPRLPALSAMATDIEATGTERAALLKVKIPVSSIYSFIDKQYDTSRLLQEGESVFEAGHVVACSVKQINVKKKK